MIAEKRADGRVETEATIKVWVGNQRFVRSMIEVAGSLGVSVFAERVTTDDEWRTLVELGVAGLTGPAATARYRAAPTPS